MKKIEKIRINQKKRENDMKIKYFKEINKK